MTDKIIKVKEILAPVMSTDLGHKRLTFIKNRGHSITLEMHPDLMLKLWDILDMWREKRERN